jgi:hypothetical protein
VLVGQATGKAEQQITDADTAVMIADDEEEAHDA